MVATRLKSNGFTLIELVIVIVVLAILAAVGIPQIGGIIQTAKISATKSEMMELKKAIVGSPQNIAGGSYICRGFEGDVGCPPSQLQDLVIKPDTIQVWNRITSLGWNGPYIDSTDGEYLIDAWGAEYVYNSSSRTITSVGSGQNIVTSF